MPSLLPTQGTVAYNGFFFPVETSTESIDGQPVLDRAQRTVMYVVWRITIRSKIIAGIDTSTPTTDAYMQSIRQRLTTQGAPFIYNNKGFGDLSINIVGNAKQDVRWGPIPRLLSCKPIGSSQAWEILWTVEVAIPECPNAVYAFFPNAVGYSVDYRQDDMGYTTRIINGYIEIPMTRFNQQRFLPDVVDRYWESVFPGMPFGPFRRKDRVRTIDESKRIMRFTVIDEEIPPQVMQYGVIDCHANHTVSNQGNTIFGRWMNTISASYTMAKDQPKADAMARFLQLCNDRVLQSIQNGAEAIIPVHFSMSDPIFERETASFSYAFTSTIQLPTLLQQTGMYTPVAGTDYQLWKISMANAFSSRGFANLGMFTTDDVIIDLCAFQPQPYPGAGFPNQAALLTGQLALPMKPPDNPLSSTLYWENYLYVECKPGTTRMKTLPLTPVDVNQSAQQATGPMSLGNPDYVQKLISPQVGEAELKTQSDPMQLRTTPTYVVWDIGSGISAGFPVIIPGLQSVGGKPVVPAGGKSWAGPIANWGVPIYAAQWAFRYEIPSLTGVDFQKPVFFQPGTGENMNGLGNNGTTKNTGQIAGNITIIDNQAVEVDDGPGAFFPGG